MNEPGVWIGLISAVVAIAAWVRAGEANTIAQRALDAQIATRIKVRCRRGVDPDLPGPVTVVLAVAENIGGLPVTIDEVYIMWFRRGDESRAGRGHSFIRALESDVGRKFPFPELPHTLEPREILQVPIPEAWFQQDLEIQMRSEEGIREFAFRFEDSRGVYYESPRMSGKCHQDDCPYRTPAEEQTKPHPLSLGLMRRRWTRFWRCR
jgi:hypothetical protein